MGSTAANMQAAYGYGPDDGPLLNCTDTSNACKYSQDMWSILQNLNVVDNNSPTTIGGGPNSDTVNRRAPQAPPFIGGATATPIGPANTPTRTATPGSGPTAIPTNWKIMPLGDSITCGDSNAGYRNPLKNLLTTGGYTTTFVGNNGAIVGGHRPIFGSPDSG